MTESEIKDTTDKLEKLVIRFEAGLSFEERQIWQKIEMLLEHFDQLATENERLKAHIKFIQSEGLAGVPFQGHHN